MLHTNVNSLPAPVQYPPRAQFSKRIDYKAEMLLSEDMKQSRGWEGSHPLKSKSIRPNQELILPSVPGGNYIFIPKYNIQLT